MQKRSRKPHGKYYKIANAYYGLYKIKSVKFSDAKKTILRQPYLSSEKKTQKHQTKIVCLKLFLPAQKNLHLKIYDKKYF